MPETATTFGAWLRHQRRQLDLTQTELAARIGYSVVTIRKLERDELRPSKQLAEQLAQHLGIAVTHRAGVVAFARTPSTHPPLADALPGQRHMPGSLAAQLTPCIGRVAELLELAQTLTDPTCRLLTVVGPGGIGKTRLALEVAQALGQQTRDSVYFVALAPLRATEHIVPAIADALDFRFQADNRLPKQQLLDYLRHKQVLLLLDNFEHLHDGVDLLQELLHGCPELRLLVTSRERLQLHSETVFVLDSLDFPSGTLTQAALAYSAVQLFVETAHRTHPKFTLDATNEQDVVRICRLVSGIPLGIILAAAWVKLLSPAEIVTELGQGFDFLEAEFRDLPTRQRSMRAVLTQSWLRLTTAEQAVFMRLAVFRGGFTRQAVQSVAGASLHTLSSLTNKSLVQRDANGRYTIHELLRQYAEAELEAAGQTADACAAHCTYYTDFLQQHEADIKGPRQVAALDEIEADFENVRAAWHWAIVQRDYASVGSALESLYWFCEMRSRFQEGLELLRSGRERLAPLAGEAPHPIWGQLMSRMVGQNSAFYEPLIESRARVATGLAIAQKDENQAELAFCLWRLAVVAYLSEDAIGAIPYFEESLAHYEVLDDRFYQGYLLKDFGILYITLGQSDRGDALVQQSLHIRRETGDPDGLATSLGAMGWITYNRGRYTEAEAYWHESYQLIRSSRERNFRSNRFQSAWLALFNRGELDHVQMLAEEAQLAAVAIGDAESEHRSLGLLGFLAGLREEYHACRQFFQQMRGLNFPYFPFTTSWEQMGLCLAACGLDDLPAARQHLRKVLEISLIHQWPPNAAKGLTFAAIIAAKSGRSEQASELLGLVFHHPLSPKGWLAQWPLITRLRAELAIALSPDRFAAAWTRGTQLDLLATAEAVVAGLAAAPVSGDARQSSS
jgi:predicted ATPase/DNA-binding XRE family transcriptional regulator